MSSRCTFLVTMIVRSIRIVSRFRHCIRSPCAVGCGDHGQRLPLTTTMPHMPRCPHAVARDAPATLHDVLRSCADIGDT